jgi:hypothetical protein
VGSEAETVQSKRSEKIERINRYFGHVRAEAYEWSLKDETIDFKSMTDQEVSRYLQRG